MIGGAEARAEARALAESGGDASAVIDLKNRRTLLKGAPFFVRISGGDTHALACTRECGIPGHVSRALVR